MNRRQRRAAMSRQGSLSSHQGDIIMSKPWKTVVTHDTLKIIGDQSKAIAICQQFAKMHAHLGGICTVPTHYFRDDYHSLVFTIDYNQRIAGITTGEEYESQRHRHGLPPLSTLGDDSRR
jgi:hypothetical protein